MTTGCSTRLAAASSAAFVTIAVLCVEYPAPPYCGPAEWMPTSPSSRDFIVSLSASYAASWLENSVSPPNGGSSTA